MSAGPVATFDAHSPEARAIATLFTQTLIICGVIAVVVTALVVYCIFRFREKPGDAEPKQIHGHTQLEVTWTLIPLAIVVGIFVLTLRAMADGDPPSEGAPDLVITGHQWWWEARYSSGAITANEIHIPVGKKLLVRIEAADVIHDFWVPQLGRKIDAVPGHSSTIWLEADAAGQYLGACAEYCGAQHAWMRIVVVAEPQAEFDAWEAHQREPAPKPSGEQATRGAKVFADRTCIKCHAISGSGEQPRVAPDLTHLAQRTTLGAGVMLNTKTDLARWLRDPQAIKPGSYMPNVQLSPSEVDDLVAYFETLK